MTTRAPGPIGSAAEDQALRLLLARGLVLMERNFRCRLGEIDLIMRDGQAVVFVEVRFRSWSACARPASRTTARPATCR